VYKAWFTFSRADYCVIITILVIIAGVGFLEGVVVGIILTVVFFVINYSRVDVVKISCSCSSYQSRVKRCRSHRKLLNEKGEEIHILQLQGFIFFGTASHLLSQMRKEIQRMNPLQLRFAVLDFERVTGLDSTAMLSFSKMIQLAKERRIVLVFTNPLIACDALDPRNSVARFFSQLKDIEKKDKEETVRIFSRIDYGLEWCENQILLQAGEKFMNDREGLHTLFRPLFPDDPINLENIFKYFQKAEVDSGFCLMKEGDPPGDLFFVESGQITAQLSSPDNPPFRLETIGGGGVVGEIGFYLNQPRTATVIANEPSTIYRLSRQRLKQMERNDPDAAHLFHQSIIRILSERLTFLTGTVNALLR
jgi:SulP family sulfate permease